jgi:class 3 adenylate cyclase
MALRGLALFIMMAWWYSASTSFRSGLLSSPALTQFILTISYICIALLMYGSYHYIVPDVHLEDVVGKHFPVPKAQIFSLNFVLVYCLLVQQCKVRLRFAFSFVLLAVAMMYVNWLDYALPIRMLFVTIAVMNMAISYEDELCSRSRYKANQAVDQTRCRVGHILDTLMPPLVVDEIRNLPLHSPAPSHKFRHATIAQSDLCGFTQLSSTKTPPQVVEFISELFGMFDVLTDTYEVYKVETVGDAYIAGMADQPLTVKNSPLNVILFGMAMVSKVGEWSRKRGFNVNCRVGVNHGECIGGIVGVDMQRYHLFGDLMTGLEILESTAPEGGVQVSKACKEEVERQLLEEGECKEFPGFQMRTEAQLKTSKGEIHEYGEIGGTSFIVKDMGVSK